MGLLDGKVAVITGAGSGMAKESTRVFVREGARVLAADISGAENDTAREVGDGVVPCHVDVTRDADVESMMQRALDEFGRVDAVLNVAGIGSQTPLTELSMEQYDQIMDVDLRGVFLGMKYGIRAMLDGDGGLEGDGGVVINWSSVGGLNGSPLPTSVYGAAKAGVIQATKTAAIEYGPRGVRVNAICPGFILTEIMGQSGSANAPSMLEKSVLGRVGRANDVAEVAAFVASDRASYLTGAIIPVDGGWSAKLA